MLSHLHAQCLTITRLSGPSSSASAATAPLACQLGSPADPACARGGRTEKAGKVPKRERRSDARMRRRAAAGKERGKKYRALATDLPIVVTNANPELWKKCDCDICKEKKVGQGVSKVFEGDFYPFCQGVPFGRCFRLSCLAL